MSSDQNLTATLQIGPRNFRVYMAGPILHQENFGREWRSELKTYDTPLIEWVDPMDLITENTDRPPEFWDIESIVEEDMEALETCDAMLVAWDTVPTAGTPMEIFYASHDLDIPVVVRADMDRGDISPWIQYFADDIFADFNSCVNRLVELSVAE